MYDNAIQVTYGFPSIDFGNGSTDYAHAIKPPPGYTMGKVVDIQAQVFETFNQTSTPAYVRLGTAGDADKYAELNLGAAADTDAYSLANTGAATNLIDLTADAISQVEVVFVHNTGGDPADTGKAHVNITMLWW